MTSSSSFDQRRMDRSTAETRFANRMSADAVQDALARPAVGDDHQGASPAWMTFRAMHQLATGVFEGDAQAALSRISADFNARRRFREILASCATGRQDRQVAAASLDTGKATTRPGRMFDLTMSPSSRNDGAFYLQVRIHEGADDGQTTSGQAEDSLATSMMSATMLFADRQGQFTMLRLPEIVDGTAQIMLDVSHDMVRAFRDPETEFFIR